MKKVLAILLAVLFVVSVTAVAASAHGGGRGWGGYGAGVDPGGALVRVVCGWVVIIGFALHTRECHTPFKLQHLQSPQKLQIQVQILQEQLYFQKQHQKIQEQNQLHKHQHIQTHLISKLTDFWRCGNIFNFLRRLI